MSDYRAAVHYEGDECFVAIEFDGEIYELSARDWLKRSNTTQEGRPSPSQIANIYRLHTEKRWTTKALSVRYNITRRSVFRIVARERAKRNGQLAGVVL